MIFIQESRHITGDGFFYTVITDINSSAKVNSNYNRNNPSAILFKSETLHLKVPLREWLWYICKNKGL